MIEVYLFYAIFITQIVVLSVLFPRLLIKRVGEMRMTQPQSEFAPRPLDDSAVATTLRTFRWLNHLIAAAGVVLLGWLFSYMQDSAWDDGPVETLVTVYFMIQLIPLTLIYFAIASFIKLLKQAAPQAKLTASLKPRRLFDFVSPLTVAVAALLYPAFIALVVIIQQNPFPGFAGYVNIIFITLLYASFALAVRVQLYAKKASPYQSHADRMLGIGIGIKIAVYSCIACVSFLSLNFTLAMLDLQQLEPLAQSVFFVLSAVLYFTGLSPLLSGFESLRAATPAARMR
jgi:hypothetical protein